MKIILAILFASIGLMQAQTPQFVRVPLQLIDGRFVVDCPYFLPATNATSGIGAVTNYVYVTNFVFYTTMITNLAPRPSVPMTNNVITSPGFRTDLWTVVLTPTNYVMGPLQVGNDVVLEVFNDRTNTITWPKNLKLPNGPLPTNSTRSWIWFKNVEGEIWASP